MHVLAHLKKDKSSFLSEWAGENNILRRFVTMTDKTRSKRRRLLPTNAITCTQSKPNSKILKQTFLSPHIEKKYFQNFMIFLWLFVVWLILELFAKSKRWWDCREVIWRSWEHLLTYQFWCSKFKSFYTHNAISFEI